ncbi:MAG: PIG-L family deacetylase [Acidobacteria bacterium]|nr:PIG-L family deacetylase [Acidobacteriota bacterium]
MSRQEGSLTFQRVILFSFAHPDDESFLAAGLACKYKAQGVDLILSTATRGEAGKVGDPPICSKEQLPEVREAELRAAVKILGIEHLYFLGYRDKELAAAPPETIREQLVRVIRRHRPGVVVTFDPNGSNLHQDHIAISRYTSDAVAAAADQRWYPDAGEIHRVARLLWTPPMPVSQVGRVRELNRQPGIDFVIDIQPWRQYKVDALRAHRSQHLAVERVFFSHPDVERQLLSVETFRQGWGPPLAHRPLDDFFTGLG